MNEDFANELKKCRLKTFLNQEEFSRRCGVKLGSYKCWETARYLPNVANLHKIISFLEEKKIETEQLFNEFVECKEI